MGLALPDMWSPMLAEVRQQTEDLGLDFWRLADVRQVKKPAGTSILYGEDNPTSLGSRCKGPRRVSWLCLEQSRHHLHKCWACHLPV